MLCVYVFVVVCSVSRRSLLCYISCVLVSGFPINDDDDQSSQIKNTVYKLDRVSREESSADLICLRCDVAIMLLLRISMVACCWKFVCMCVECWCILMPFQDARHP